MDEYGAKFIFVALYIKMEAFNTGVTSYEKKLTCHMASYWTKTDSFKTATVRNSEIDFVPHDFF